MWLEDIRSKDKQGKRLLGTTALRLDEYISTITIAIVRKNKITEQFDSKLI